MQIKLFDRDVISAKDAADESKRSSKGKKNKGSKRQPSRPKGDLRQSGL